MTPLRLSLLSVSLGLLLLSGCSSQSYSIRELGHPAFEEVVGKETEFERADPSQRMGMDAYTSDVEDDADHSFGVSFWPAGTKDKIGLEVRARSKSSLGLDRLAVAVFAVSQSEASRFDVTGQLPDAASPIAYSSKSEVDEDDNVILTLVFKRDAVPAGTEKLAIPTLAQFEDGWIHIKYYSTVVPNVIRPLTKEEVEQLKKLQEAEKGKEAGGGEAKIPPSDDPPADGTDAAKNP